MNSIRAKLVLPLLAGIVLLSTAAGVLLYFSIRSTIIIEFDESLRSKASTLATLVHVIHNGQLDFDYSDENFSEFQSKDQPEYFQIRLVDGTTWQRSTTLGDEDLPLVAGSERNPGAATTFRTVQLPNGRDGRMFSITRRALLDLDDDQMPPPDKLTGASPLTLPLVTISVAKDTADLDRTLARLRNALIFGVAALAACVAVLVPLVIRRALRPLDAIAQHAASLNAQSLGSAFPKNNLPVELLPISQRLNELLDRLAGSFEREKRFSASAAHELRTPIAEIRAVAEVALQWPDLERSQRALGDVVEVSERMHLLIDALLKLARAQSGEIVVQQSEISPFSLAQKTLRALSSIVQQKRLSIRLEKPTGNHALSDPALAAAMIGNLVANAAHHSPSHGQILIDECSANGSVQLTIVNDCAPGAQPSLKLMCEPFWTGSTSRADQRHGLGLALVREYARLLDTQVSFDLVGERQFRATVRFRAAEKSTRSAASSVLPVDARGE